VAAGLYILSSFISSNLKDSTNKNKTKKQANSGNYIIRSSQSVLRTSGQARDRATSSHLTR